MPKVSVIIPTYNRASMVVEAIDSILAQTYRDFEIVVVDDGSTDDTAVVLRRFNGRIKYIYRENGKQPAARNTGIAASSGEYLAFLDSDDRFLPEKLAIQVALLDASPDTGLVASGYEYIDESDRLLESCRPWRNVPSINLETILYGGLAPPVAVLLRRCWLDEIGYFDPDLPGAEDMDLWYRLALAGCAMAWDKSISCQYRIHASNMSWSPQIHFANTRRALDKAFNDPRIPDSLRRKQPWIDAQLDLAEAVRLSAGGWEDIASERIRRAITTAPELMENKGRGLAEIVVGQQSTVWGNGHFGGFVTEVLRDDLPALKHTLAVVAAQKRFYTANGERQAAEVRRAWLDVARHDPRWLLNRGGWSILRQSIIGREHRTGVRE